jgi:hypothetical protein
MSDPEHENFVAFVNALHLTKGEWAEASDILDLLNATGASVSQMRDAIVRRFGHRQTRFLVADGRIAGGLN